MAPKPATAFALAAEPKTGEVVELFAPKPVAVDKEIPAYLRFPDVREYSAYQLRVQRAILNANLAELEAQKHKTPDVQSRDNTWRPMGCPWSLAGRKPQP